MPASPSRSRERSGTSRRQVRSDYEAEDRRRPRHSSESSEDEDRRRRKSDRDGRSNRSHRHRRDYSEDDQEPPRDRDDGRSKRRRRSKDRSRHRNRSRSPDAKRRKQSNSRSRSPPRRSKAPLPSQDASFRQDVVGPAGQRGDPPAPEKQKPNWKPTGLLAKEANTVAGTTTVLKYHEPAEARKPPAKEAWRMYVFRKKDLIDTVYLFQRSCWLMGRDQHVTDLTLDHPSISKQHAVVQFRHQTITNEYGDRTNKVRPYLIDLESANGTSLNGKKIETSRYVELVDGDVVGFGDSEREYVMMLPPPA